MKSKRRKIFGNIIFYTFILFMALYIGMSAFSPSRVIDVFRFQGMPVLTPSMEPKIKVNDYIIITKTNPDELKEHDIISFYTYLPTVTGGYSRQIVTHYIYDILEDDDGRYFLTYSELKDINGEYVVDEWVNQQGDVFIRDEDIIGKYQFKVPAIGAAIIFAQQALRNPIMIVLIIINIAVIVTLIKYILKKPKEEQK
jgi:signal peptidase I